MGQFRNCGRRSWAIAINRVRCAQALLKDGIYPRLHGIEMYTKLAAAAIVLVVGFALASLFPKREGHTPESDATGGVALRRADAESSRVTPGGQGESTPSIGLASPAGKQLASWPEALVSNRNEAAVPLREPPPLPPEYAAHAAADPAHTAPSELPSRQAFLPRQPDTTQRTIVHQVVDGDTLSHIAANYLGDSALGHRISEANGGNVSDPLVVGSELRIPPPLSRIEPQLTAARPAGAQTRLVPVAPAQVMADAE
jgi:hypothetical protein